MSLVGTTILCTDGKFREDVEIHHDGWFLCFDDDEPPELVIKEGVKIEPILKRLRKAGLKFRIIGKSVKAIRCFFDISNMEWSQGYFLEITKPLPVELITKSKPPTDKPEGQSVVYHFGQWWSHQC